MESKVSSFSSSSKTQKNEARACLRACRQTGGKPGKFCLVPAHPTRLDSTRPVLALISLDVHLPCVEYVESTEFELFVPEPKQKVQESFVLGAGVFSQDLARSLVPFIFLSEMR